MKKILLLVLLTISFIKADITIVQTGDPDNTVYMERLKKIANKHNIKLIEKKVPWKRAMKMVEKGIADGIINASYKESRAKFANYPMTDGKLDTSKRLNDGSSYFLFKNKKSTIKWDGKQFTSPDGAVKAKESYAVVDDLKKHDNISIEFGTYPIAMLREVATNKIAAYAGLQEDFDELAKKQPNLAKEIVKEDIPVRSKYYYLIFSKKTYDEKKKEMELIWNGLKEFN